MSRRHEALVAQAAGLIKFESASLCKKCGGSTFYSSTSMCCSCLASRQKSNRAEANCASRKWRAANKDKQRESTAEWYTNNPGACAAYRAKYRAAVLQRTPAWADLEAIKQFYAGCPAGYHVDHIVPLQGELVSGLHVLSNLQYLPAAANLAKGNKFDIC